ncbi:MAG: hypothetical protein H6Q05_3819 [Acidobacteria bacterium]|jgi:hypothetical protein|nr:hypothetical protein [Acidobacteriota bacterium]
MEAELKHRGRTVTAADLEVIRRLIAENPGLSRRARCGAVTFIQRYQNWPGKQAGHSILATPPPGFGNRSKTAESWPGTIRLGLEAMLSMRV